MSNIERNTRVAESFNVLNKKYSVNDAMSKLMLKRRELGHTQEIAEIIAHEMVADIEIQPIPVQGEQNA